MIFYKLSFAFTFSGKEKGKENCFIFDNLFA